MQFLREEQHEDEPAMTYSKLMATYCFGVRVGKRAPKPNSCPTALFPRNCFKVSRIFWSTTNSKFASYPRLKHPNSSKHHQQKKMIPILLDVSGILGGGRGSLGCLVANLPKYLVNTQQPAGMDLEEFRCLDVTWMIE